MNRQSRIGAVLGALLLTMLLAACGSDSSDGNSASDGGGEAGSPGVVEARKTVAELSQRPTEIGLTEPAGKPIPKGKRIYFIQCTVPSCVTLGENLQEAADALGWKLTRVNAGLTPETVKNAYEKAVREKPDGVIGTGFPRSVFERELADLKAAGIPVVELATADRAGDGITAVLNASDAVVQDGKDRAAWITADSGGDANTLLIDTGTFPTVGIEFDSFKKEYGRLCDGCKVETLKVPATSIGRDLPTRIVGHLRTNPDVDYVAVGFNDMAIGLPGALRDAGMADDVKVIARDSSPTIAQHIEKGEVAATIGVPWPESMWRSMDVLARVFTDQPVEPSADAPQPRWIVTAKHVPSTEKTFPLVEDYTEQYKRLWQAP